MKHFKEDENGLWEEGGFIESINPEELKKKMSTFHKSHNEDMDYNCKKCAK